MAGTIDFTAMWAFLNICIPESGGAMKTFPGIVLAADFALTYVLSSHKNGCAWLGDRESEWELRQSPREVRACMQLLSQRCFLQPLDLFQWSFVQDNFIPVHSLALLQCNQ